MVTVETNLNYEEKDGGLVLFQLPKYLAHLHKMPDTQQGYLGPIIHTRNGSGKTPLGTLRAIGKHWIAFTFSKNTNKFFSVLDPVTLNLARLGTVASECLLTQFHFQCSVVMTTDSLSFLLKGKIQLSQQIADNIRAQDISFKVVSTIASDINKKAQEKGKTMLLDAFARRLQSFPSLPQLTDQSVSSSHVQSGPMSATTALAHEHQRLILFDFHDAIKKLSGKFDWRRSWIEMTHLLSVIYESSSPFRHHNVIDVLSEVLGELGLSQGQDLTENPKGFAPFWIVRKALDHVRSGVNTICKQLLGLNFKATYKSSSDVFTYFRISLDYFRNPCEHDRSLSGLKLTDGYVVVYNSAKSAVKALFSAENAMPTIAEGHYQDFLTLASNRPTGGPTSLKIGKDWPSANDYLDHLIYGSRVIHAVASQG